MSTLTMTDLRYLYYGGGSQAEKDYLQAAFDAGVSADDVLALVISGGGGGGSGTPVAIKDEGTTLTAGATSINFVGANIAATNTGSIVTVTAVGDPPGSAATAQVNAQAFAIQRANHTGTQLIATISDMAAVRVPFSPVGSLASTNVQAALAELDTHATSIPALGAGTGIQLPTPSGGIQLIQVDTSVVLTSNVQNVTAAKTFAAATLLVAGASTGVAVLAYPSTSTNNTLTFPAITDTLVTKTTTDTLTNKTIDTASNSIMAAGTLLAPTGITGTGNLVHSANPVLTASVNTGITVTQSLGGNSPITSFSTTLAAAQVGLVDICRGGPSDNVGVINTNALGTLRFRGTNGVGTGSYNVSATIGSTAEESFDATHGGSNLRLSTTLLGAVTPTERMRFSSDGTARIAQALQVGGAVLSGVPTWALHIQAGATNISGVGIDVSTVGPIAPASNASGVISIFKGTTNYYILITFNDAGTTRYKYLQLNGTGVTWVTGTSLPA